MTTPQRAQVEANNHRTAKAGELLTTPQGTPQHTYGTVNNLGTNGQDYLTIPQGTPQGVKIDTAAC